MTQIRESRPEETKIQLGSVVSYEKNQGEQIEE
jgi:hypothetical protein